MFPKPSLLTPLALTISLTLAAPTGATPYKTALASIITANDFCLNPSIFQKLPVSTITQSVVNDAIAQQPSAQTILFKNLTPQNQPNLVAAIASRPAPKTLSRVAEKASFTDFNDKSKPDPTRDWKINTDLSAFRIDINDVQKIESVRQQIAQNAQAVPGSYACLRPGRFPGQIDLTAFMYVYLANEYVSEVQVNHPFATWAFARDSYNDHRKEGQPMKYPDAWGKGWGNGKVAFYKAMRALILDPTNPDTQFDVKGAVEELVPKGEVVESGLVEILRPYVKVPPGAGGWVGTGRMTAEEEGAEQE